MRVYLLTAMMGALLLVGCRQPEPPSPTQAEIKARVRQLWQEGANFKHAGRIELAQRLWEEALGLDPGNFAIWQSVQALDKIPPRPVEYEPVPGPPPDPSPPPARQGVSSLSSLTGNPEGWGSPDDDYSAPVRRTGAGGYSSSYGSHSRTSSGRHYSSSYGGPSVAENGDVAGADNDGDGRSEPVHVHGYYRKDGTYVRGHYRARPRR